MPEIILSEEQAALLAQAGQTLRVRDPRGRMIGFLEPAPSEEEIARAKERMKLDEPEYSTAEVLEYLGSLEK